LRVPEILSGLIPEILSGLRKEIPKARGQVWKVEAVRAEGNIPDLVLCPPQIDATTNDAIIALAQQLLRPESTAITLLGDLKGKTVSDELLSAA
jgi:hypothetical protein